MLQGSKLGTEQLHLLNDLDLFYPLYMAQFLAADDNKDADKVSIKLRMSRAIVKPDITDAPRWPIRIASV